MGFLVSIEHVLVLVVGQRPLGVGDDGPDLHRVERRLEDREQTAGEAVEVGVLLPFADLVPARHRGRQVVFRHADGASQLFQGGRLLDPALGQFHRVVLAPVVAPGRMVADGREQRSGDAAVLVQDHVGRYPREVLDVHVVEAHVAPGAVLGRRRVLVHVPLAELVDDDPRHHLGPLVAALQRELLAGLGQVAGAVAAPGSGGGRRWGTRAT